MAAMSSMRSSRRALIRLGAAVATVIAAAVATDAWPGSCERGGEAGADRAGCVTAARHAWHLHAEAGQHARGEHCRADQVEVHADGGRRARRDPVLQVRRALLGGGLEQLQGDAVGADLGAQLGLGPGDVAALQGRSDVVADAGLRAKLQPGALLGVGRLARTGGGVSSAVLGLGQHRGPVLALAVGVLGGERVQLGPLGVLQSLATGQLVEPLAALALAYFDLLLGGHPYHL